MKKPLSVILGALGVVLAAIAVVTSMGSAIPAAFADPRFPQPEFHCDGNPHSDEPTGNPHDVGINEHSNPHDLLVENGGECEPNPHSPK